MENSAKVKTEPPTRNWMVAYYSKKLFSLNSSVMDDNYDTYKTANIEINQLFF
jgi:hypothetical protein